MQRFRPSSLKKLLGGMVIVLLVIIVARMTPGVRWVTAWIDWIAHPVISFAGTVGGEISSSVQYWFTLGEMKRENAELKKEIETLKVERIGGETMQRENTLLREQLGFQQRSNHPSIEGQIIGRDIFGVSQQVTIDIGERHGVTRGAGVVSASGVFIGTVSSVSETQSVVRFITDSRSVVPVRVSSTSSEGVIQGRHGLDVDVKYVPLQPPLSAGMDVVTSGLGGNLPADMLIGRVTDVRTSTSGLFQEATLRLAVFLEDIQNVYVLSRTR